MYLYARIATVGNGVETTAPWDDKQEFVAFPQPLDPTDIALDPITRRPRVRPVEIVDVTDLDETIEMKDSGTTVIEPMRVLRVFSAIPLPATEIERKAEKARIERTHAAMPPLQDQVFAICQLFAEYERLIRNLIKMTVLDNPELIASSDLTFAPPAKAAGVGAAIVAALDIDRERPVSGY